MRHFLPATIGHKPLAESIWPARAAATATKSATCASSAASQRKCRAADFARQLLYLFKPARSHKHMSAFCGQDFRYCPTRATALRCAEYNCNFALKPSGHAQYLSFLIQLGIHWLLAIFVSRHLSTHCTVSSSLARRERKLFAGWLSSGQPKEQPSTMTRLSGIWKWSRIRSA